MIDNEQEGRWCVDQSFTLEEIGKKALEKKHRVFSGIKSIYADSLACDRVGVWVSGLG